MPSSSNAARSAGTRAHALLCLLIMLTFLRAFIPTGFMPDPVALAQGRFALMPCPAAGGLPQQVSLFGAEGSASHTRHKGPAAADVSPGHAGHGQYVAANVSDDIARHPEPVDARIAQAGHATHAASADSPVTAATERSGPADAPAPSEYSGPADVTAPSEYSGPAEAPAPSEHSGHADATAKLDCPFSLLAHVSANLPPPVALAILTAQPDVDRPAFVQQSRPPLPAAGPPLGSRAPPLQA